MPKRAAVTSPTTSPQTHRNRPDSFCKYRSQVSELLSQGERISHHDQQASERHSNSVIGVEMSNLEKEKLNVLLRQCVRDLAVEVDEMQQRIYSMNLIRSSPTTFQPEELGGANEDDIQLILRSDPDLVKKITSQYSNVLLSKMENMQQQLEKLLDDVMTTCRPMTCGEVLELQKAIKKLPETNLNRVAELIGNHHITSGKDFKDEIIVNLVQADNIMLWRLHFYIKAVKSAQNLVKLP